jgi:hypothetical protein
MFSRFVLILILATVAQAQGALVKGSVILNGEGGQGVANVLITDSAHTGGPWATGSDGGFTLEYPNRAPGERVRLGGRPAVSLSPLGNKIVRDRNGLAQSTSHSTSNPSARSSALWSS